jgi:hypothetical protein
VSAWRCSERAGGRDPSHVAHHRLPESLPDISGTVLAKIKIASLGAALWSGKRS